jgi:hypothetical protein
MQPSHADIDHELGGAAEVLGGEQGLAGDREVGGAGGDDDDETAGRLGRLGWPREHPGVDVVARVGQFVEDGLGMGLLGPGEQGDDVVSVADGGCDGGDLLGCLAFAVDRLRYPRRVARSESRMANAERSGASAGSAMCGLYQGEGEGTGPSGDVDGGETQPDLLNRGAPCRLGRASDGTD